MAEIGWRLAWSLSLPPEDHGRLEVPPPTPSCLVSLLHYLRTVRTLEYLSGGEGAVQPGGLKRTLSDNGVKEAKGVWGRGVGTVR